MSFEIFYKYRNQKKAGYITGILLEKDDNEEFKLWIAQKPRNEGTLYKKWMFPSKKDKTPSDKPFPWIVPLGNQNEAVEIFKYFLQQITNPKARE